MQLGELILKMAGRTGLEPAASGVTGRRYNQLNYRPSDKLMLYG